ncbi:hypothetical protein [Castellaniella sp.]|uniref:hypothetical protein n=1 Tax=Castellaniella sp. TaxID=1955812 RepID=UPI002AFE344D|nr:hypothetical protein [Castellaniella sp.]
MGLKPYIPKFKAIVLAHLQKMRNEEWAYFRGCARDLPAVAVDYAVESTETRESVLNGAVSLDSGPSVEETINASQRFSANATRIGEIDGQPLYYINGTGIYLWGPTPQSPATISFWATFPAYPPGW